MWGGGNNPPRHFIEKALNIRLKIAAIFTIAISIGYFTGVHVTKDRVDSYVQQALLERDSAVKSANDIEARLNSLCGDAMLKFVPCPAGLEVCVCGGPDKYLTK